MHISELTIENVTPVIREIVADYGEDYVYDPGIDGCLYQKDGKPSCLIGHVFDRMGVPYNEDWEGTRAGKIVDDNGGNYKLSSALYFAQFAQDDELPWGEALREFESHAK